MEKVEVVHRVADRKEPKIPVHVLFGLVSPHSHQYHSLCVWLWERKS